MIRRFGVRDTVAVTGSFIGLVSILFGWLTIRPNRIATGTSLSLWDSVDWPGVTVVVLLWFVCMAAALLGRGRLKGIILGVTTNLILIVSFLLVGWASSHLLEGESQMARVSLGAGVWLTLVGAYVVVFSVRRILDGLLVLQLVFSSVGVVVFIGLLIAGWFEHLSIMQEFSGYEERFFQEFRQHVFLFGISVITGTILGILLGIWATRSRRAEKPIFYLANITQTIPSLALFGLLIAPLSALSFTFPILRDLGIRGVGVTPALIALVIYSLLPIVRNTYVGLRQVDPAAIDAGLGMGMTRGQIFRRIEVPLAAPLVLEGVRIASVQAVGLTTVAALIGAGGLGWFIFRGTGQQASDLILLGAIPIIVMALFVDVVMRTVVRLATPRGMLGGVQ